MKKVNTGLLKKIKVFLSTLTWNDIFTFLKNYRSFIEEVGKLLLALFLLIHLVIALVFITKQDLQKFLDENKDVKSSTTSVTE